ncbi:hypothetical protein [uncultured Gammaproteobacteria bacterium]|nr:hypothetical protein [uncultured Gammaproteobacteria bacterium]
MKKTLAITILLTSTLLNATHGSHQPNFFNHHPTFNQNFWRDFNHQFQQFNHQMNELQHDAHAVNTYSKQYFDKASNHYVVKIKTPGIDKVNFNISTDKNNLIIKAKQNSKSGNRSSSSYFSQVISIPKDGDADNIMTEFKEGVLKISIPKLDKPKPQTRKITIQ